MSLYLFTLALKLLSASARGIAQLLTAFSIHGVLNLVGFGWVAAYGALSGSPVAALARVRFAHGVRWAPHTADTDRWWGFPAARLPLAGALTSAPVLSGETFYVFDDPGHLYSFSFSP